MKSPIVAGSLALLFAGIASAQETPGAGKLPPPIEALKPAKVAWREIAWKSCLLDGLRESRAKGNPIPISP